MSSIRTCTFCRTKSSKTDFLRFVRALDGEVIFDKNNKLPTRGIWFCANSRCLKNGLNKKNLFKNEKVLPLNLDEMLNSINLKIKESVLNRLGILRKMGLCEAGREAVKKKIYQKEVKIVFLASDLSIRSKQELLDFFCLYKDEFLVCDDMFCGDDLSNSIGKPQTGVVGFLKGRITNELEKDLIRFKSLTQQDYK